MKNLVKLVVTNVFVVTVLLAGNAQAMQVKETKDAQQKKHIDSVKSVLEKTDSKELAEAVESQLSAACYLGRQHVIDFLFSHDTYKKYVNQNMLTQILRTIKSQKISQALCRADEESIGS